MKRAFVIAFAVVWLNGLACLIHSSVVGGGAINGKVEDGKCYVGDAGRYTEVSPPLFQFMQWHEITVVSGIACVLFAGLVVFVLQKTLKRQII